MSRTVRRLHERIEDERGFTLVEAIMATSILAVASFAIAQSILFGLKSTGLARNRLAARAAIEQQMELARALNFDSVVLSDTSPIPHVDDKTSPDFWVDEVDQTYDPDGDGPLTPEDIVRVPGANPSVQHYQSPVVQGSTTFEIFFYVTWVDMPGDGLGVADQADGDGNGQDDSNGHDAKRVTVVVSWTDPVTREVRTTQSSSLFADEIVPYQGVNTTNNVLPTVACPTSTNSGATYTFKGSGADTDGSIIQTTWAAYPTPGPQNATTLVFSGTGSTFAWSFADTGTYQIINTVYDNDGGSATNSSLNCEVSVVDTGSAAEGTGGPSGTIVIKDGATYTNTEQVTLTLSSSGATKMHFSTDGTTWTKYTYDTSADFTLTAGDGTKTVYARFWAAGKFGAWATDTIVLDTTAPNGATSLFKVSSSNSGGNKLVTIQWTEPSPPSADQAGYFVWIRATTSTDAYSQAACTSLASNRCVATLSRNTSYGLYVTYYDQAGNLSAPTNAITV